MLKQRRCRSVYNCALKMINFALKMLDSVFKMSNFGRHELHPGGGGQFADADWDDWVRFSTPKYGIYTQTDGIYTKNGGVYWLQGPAVGVVRAFLCEFLLAWPLFSAVFSWKRMPFQRTVPYVSPLLRNFQVLFGNSTFCFELEIRSIVYRLWDCPPDTCSTHLFNTLYSSTQPCPLCTFAEAV